MSSVWHNFFLQQLKHDNVLTSTTKSSVLHQKRYLLVAHFLLQQQKHDNVLRNDDLFVSMPQMRMLTLPALFGRMAKFPLLVKALKDAGIYNEAAFSRLKIATRVRCDMSRCYNEKGRPKPVPLALGWFRVMCGQRYGYTFNSLLFSSSAIAKSKRVEEAYRQFVTEMTSAVEHFHAQFGLPIVNVNIMNLSSL